MVLYFRFRYVFVLFAGMLLGSGCKTDTKVLPPDAQHLYEKYANSVALVRNEYYYDIALNDGMHLYFYIGENGEPLFAGDLDEAMFNASVIYGTGFFIGQDGLLATNRHVATPPVDQTEILAQLSNQIMLEQHLNADLSAALEYRREELYDYIESNRDQMSSLELYEWENQLSSLEDSILYLTMANIMMDIDLSDATIECKSKLSIAYHHSDQLGDKAFYPCQFLSQSNKEEIDLALIQLSSGKTPSFVKEIFSFTDLTPTDPKAEVEQEHYLSKPLAINQQLYMIGFNYGPGIGLTSAGLKAQFTQGTVSQESDGTRVLYSIPSLEGSSGSPVIDQWGNLVAINYAGVRLTQSFNYGIMASHLKTLLANR